MPGTQEALSNCNNSVITLIPVTSSLITMTSPHFTPLGFTSLLLVIGVKALGKPSSCCTIYTDLKYACKLDPMTHFLKSLWTQRPGFFFNFFLTEVQLIYNVVLISGVQQSDSIL